MIENEPTIDKCKYCNKRREDGFMICDRCGNKLWADQSIGFIPCEGMYSYDNRK